MTTMTSPTTKTGRAFIERHGTAKTEEVLAIEQEAAAAAVREALDRRRTNDQATPFQRGYDYGHQQGLAIVRDYREALERLTDLAQADLEPYSGNWERFYDAIEQARALLTASAEEERSASRRTEGE